MAESGGLENRWSKDPGVRIPLPPPEASAGSPDSSLWKGRIVGLVRRFAKPLQGKPCRGFESHPFRHHANQARFWQERASSLA